MCTIRKYVLAVTASLAIAGAANATVITFDGLPQPNGSIFSGPYAESGYSVSATGGRVYEGHLFGNPLPSLVVGLVFDPNSIISFGTIEVTRSGGGGFDFSSFDLIGNNGPASYVVQGFLGAASVFSYGGSQTSPFATIAGPASTIDRLVFNLTANGTSLNLDNIAVNDPVSLTAVPEPATFALMIAGFGLAGFAMRSKRSGVRVKYI